MARQPGDTKIISEIINQLDLLEPDGLAQIAARAQELHHTKHKARQEEFVARVRQEAAEMGLDPVKLFSPVPAGIRKLSGRKRGRGIVPPAFRSPDGVMTWSGRGKTPTWLVELERQGHTREEYRIRDADLMHHEEPEQEPEHEEAA